MCRTAHRKHEHVPFPLFILQKVVPERDPEDVIDPQLLKRGHALVWNEEQKGEGEVDKPRARRSSLHPGKDTLIRSQTSTVFTIVVLKHLEFWTRLSA